jgi:hypothetical protein
LEISNMSDTSALSAGALDYRIAGNDVVVHDPEHERVHVLNKVAAFILQSCDGRHSAQGIADELSTHTGAPRARILADVERTLTELRALELVH